MKKYIFIMLILLTGFGVQAQQKGKIRVGGNIGMDFPYNGFGGSIDLLDVRYNLQDNWNVGAKLGGALMFRDLNKVDNVTAENTVHINSNFMLVSDYYFNKGTSMFAPFIGGSFGTFSIYDIYMLVDLDDDNYYKVDNMPAPDRTFGGALRAGFELGKFRMAMEYYFIPQTNKYDVDNIMVPAGTSNNSYLTLNLGFYFGGGKWRK